MGVGVGISVGDGMSVGVGEGIVGVGCGVAVGVGVVLSQAIEKMIASIPTSNRKYIGRTSLRCRISRSLSHLLTYDRYYLSDMMAHSCITAESGSGTYAEVMVTASTASTTMAATGIKKAGGPDDGRSSAHRQDGAVTLLPIFQHLQPQHRSYGMARQHTILQWVCGD